MHPWLLDKIEWQFYSYENEHHYRGSYGIPLLVRTMCDHNKTNARAFASWDRDEFWLELERAGWLPDRYQTWEWRDKGKGKPSIMDCTRHQVCCERRAKKDGLNAIKMHIRTECLKWNHRDRYKGSREERSRRDGNDGPGGSQYGGHGHYGG